VVECRRFAVGILMICFIVSEYYYFWLVGRHLGFSTQRIASNIMTAGHLDVLYVVIYPCIVFGTTCIYNPTKLLLLPAIWLQFWISSTHRRPAKPEVPPLDRFTPKKIVVAVGILMTCFIVSEILLLPVGWPPSWISGARRCPTKPDVPPLKSLTW